MVKVTALFTIDVSNMGCNKSDDCVRFMDQKFILPDYLQAEMISNSIKEVATIYKQIPYDININKNEAT